MRKEYTPQEKEKALLDFDDFIFRIDDVLEKFIEEAAYFGYNLDFSVDSLDQLEEYALKLDAKVLSDFHGQAAQYMGDIMYRHFGYRWELSLDLKNNSLHYGKPVLVNLTNSEVQFAPYAVVRNFLIRRVKGILKVAVLNHVSPKLLDLSDLPTEAE